MGLYKRLYGGFPVLIFLFSSLSENLSHGIDTLLQYLTVLFIGALLQRIHYY